MPNFWHLALIEGAIFGPEALKAVGQAFDEAWAGQTGEDVQLIRT